MDKYIVRGIVRGKNIELDEAPPIPEGEPVTVEIHPNGNAGDGIRASAGAWAEAGEELDRWLESVYQARHAGRSLNSQQ